MKIIIEGNIGSGKSTFLSYLDKYFNANIIYEPVDYYTNVNGINFLKLLYNDPAKWGFSFQIMASTKKLQLLDNSSELTFMERSYLSDCNCFTELLKDNGNISLENYIVLKEYYNSIPDQNYIIIYFRTNPEVSYERIIKRHRKDEKISYEYISDLHKKYESWLIGNSIVIDANKEFINSEPMIDNIINKITNAIPELNDYRKNNEWTLVKRRGR